MAQASRVAAPDNQVAATSHTANVPPLNRFNLVETSSALVQKSVVGGGQTRDQKTKKKFNSDVVGECQSAPCRIVFKAPP